LIKCWLFVWKVKSFANKSLIGHIYLIWKKRECRYIIYHYWTMKTRFENFLEYFLFITANYFMIQMYFIYMYINVQNSATNVKKKNVLLHSVYCNFLQICLTIIGHIKNKCWQSSWISLQTCSVQSTSVSDWSFSVACNYLHVLSNQIGYIWSLSTKKWLWCSPQRQTNAFLKIIYN
jgi:hypothetical protein